MIDILKVETVTFRKFSEIEHKGRFLEVHPATSNMGLRLSDASDLVRILMKTKADPQHEKSLPIAVDQLGIIHNLRMSAIVIPLS